MVLRRVRLSGALRLGAAAAASAIVAVPSCHGDWSFALPPPEAGTPATQYEEACSTWAASYCAYEARCDPTDLFFSWQTQLQCVARETLGCELAAGDPNAAFDAERVRGCRYPDDCSGTSLPTCFAPGRAGAGSACLWHSTCESGVCIGTGSSYPLCGTCYDCTAPCPSGLTCNGIVGGGSCPERTRLPGQSCTSADQCQSAVCEMNDAGPRACAPFAEVGDPCGAPSARCGRNAFCDDSGHCNPYRFATDAGRCGPVADGGGAFAYCGGSAVCLGNECIAPAADGDPCDPASGLRCLWPAVCVASRCIYPTLADCPL